MRKVLKTAAAAIIGLSTLIATPAMADISCPFTLSNVGVDAGGDVFADFTANGTTNFWYVCNLQGSINVNTGAYGLTITSGLCSAMYSQLLTVKSSNVPLNVWFHTLTNCTTGLPAQSSWFGASTNQYPSSFSF